MIKKITAFPVILCMLMSCINVAAASPSVKSPGVYYRTANFVTQFSIASDGVDDPVYSVEGGDGDDIAIDSKTGLLTVYPSAEAGNYTVRVQSESDSSVSSSKVISITDAHKFDNTVATWTANGHTSMLANDDIIGDYMAVGPTNRIATSKHLDISSENGGSMTVEYDLGPGSTKLLQIVGLQDSNTATTYSAWYPSTFTSIQSLDAWSHITMIMDFDTRRYQIFRDGKLIMENDFTSAGAAGRICKIYGLIISGDANAKLANVEVYSGVQTDDYPPLDNLRIGIEVQGETVVLNGRPEKEICWKVYSPCDTSTVETSFSNACAKEHTHPDITAETGSAFSDSDGMVQIPLENYEPGLYRIYAWESGNENQTEKVFEVKKSELYVYKINVSQTVEEVEKQLVFIENDRYNNADLSLKKLMAQMIFETRTNYTDSHQIHTALNEYKEPNPYEGKTVIVGENTLFYPQKLHDFLYWDYTLYIDGEPCDDAVWSIMDEVQGVCMDNGRLKINSEFDEKTLTIKAETEDIVLTKKIDFTKLISFDFEDGLNGFTAKGSVSLEDALKTDENGNSYLDPCGTRIDSAPIMTSVLKNPLTLEFDFMVTYSGEQFSIAPASRMENGALNTNVWWLMLQANSDVNGKADIAPLGISYNIGKTDMNKWSHMAIDLDVSSGYPEADIWLNRPETPLEAGNNIFGKNISDFKIGQMITTMPVDNVMVHNGRTFGTLEITNVNIPAMLMTSRFGETKTLALETVVCENGEESVNPLVTYRLKEESESVSIQENVLTYTPDAEGEITIMVTAGRETLEKKVKFIYPNTGISINGNIINLDGTPSTLHNVILCGPRYTSTPVQSFLDAWSLEEPGSEIVMSKMCTTNESGEAEITLEGLKPGRYQVYVTEEGSDTPSWEIFDYDIDSLVRKNAESNFSDEAFCEILKRICPDAEKITDMIKEISDVEKLTELTEGEFENLPSATAYMSFIEDMTDAGKADEAVFYGADSDAINLAMANSDTKLLKEKLKDFSSLKNSQAELKEQAILCGIYSVVNKRDAKQFLEKMQSKTYDNASGAMKDAIALEVAKKQYESIEALKRAIDDVDESGGSSGNSGGSKKGGGGVSKLPDISANTVPFAEISYFKDVETSHWAYKAIGAVSESNLMVGYEGLFRPEDEITRAEFVKTLVVAFGIEGGGSHSFTDVDANAWYEPYIRRASGAGLVLGDGLSFYPDNSITRQDAVVMIYRFATHVNTSFDEVNDNEFADGEQISDYAKEAVEKMFAKGLVSGTGENCFAPLKTLTRAEAAMLMSNLMQRSVIAW